MRDEKGALLKPQFQSNVDDTSTLPNKASDIKCIHDWRNLGDVEACIKCGVYSFADPYRPFAIKAREDYLK